VPGAAAASPVWAREAEPDVAAARILDAAERAFVEVGVERAGMSKIAKLAGCSRGTLYRYFKTRRELQLAYVERAAREIHARLEARLADIDDPRERVVEGILGAVREVRRRPGTAAWFDPGVSGLAAQMSRASELVEALTRSFSSRALGGAADAAEVRLRAHFIVRIIVSLLALPGASPREERALVERFVAPAILR
jgi:AcrR family transcriptional regulator